MKKSKTLTEIMKMAEEYGVKDNALFCQAAAQYDLQVEVIQRMRLSLDDNDVMTTKEYVKGRENLCANPIIKELPKNCDSANRTLQTMLDIITKLGKKKELTDSKLAAFIND